MLQVKYKNDGECQKYGTLTFRIYAAEEVLTNIYFKLNAPDFFRGCIKERCIFLPYIGAGEYSEFSIPFRSMRGFNSPQITFVLDVQCTINRGGNSSSICWNGSFIRNFAVEKAAVQHTTYHIENKTTLNASENAIAYAGGTSNNYTGFQNENDSTAEIDFSVVPGNCRIAAVQCDEFLLVKIDTGKDLERGVRNELTICFDPCYRVGFERNFSMKKIAGTLSVSGKTQMFYTDKFFAVEQFVGGYRYERYYCRIPVVLPENVPQLDLCQLTCSGEMNGQDFCLSMPQNIACTLWAPREPEFSDIEDLGKLSMFFEENAEELFRNAEQIENSEIRKNMYMRALPTAPEKIHREILNKIGKNSYSHLDFSETEEHENISVLHLISSLDAYKEEKQEIKRETELQKACRLYGEFGNGLNPEYAYGIFLKEYDAGNENSVAATRLAECYILGIGTEQNLSKGNELMRHAADAGNPEAMLNYSECCFAGIGTVKNIDAGKKYLLAAAESGNSEAMCKLAGLYLVGKIFPVNYEEAKRLYIQANTLDAKYSLACMKYFGLAEERNIPAAVEGFAELSKLGHIPSKIMYVNCLANGIGIEQDIAKADAICAEIPEKSGGLNGVAYKNAAMMNFRQKNYNKAVDLLQKAVKMQNAEAAFILAQQCYIDGVGVPRSGVVAVELLKWASRKNHKKSQLQLAEYLLRGIGVCQDYSKAVEILRKFDGCNDPHYLFLMGMCQYHGWGIAEDEAAGLRLLKRSADAGYPPAVEYLEDIE